jgi:hypothetical protein
MAMLDDYADWDELFAEFRLLVISNGFAAWDAAAVLALAEEEASGSRPRYQLLRYCEWFMAFLKIRHSVSLEEMQSRLRLLVHTAEGEDVIGAAVIPDGESALRPRQSLLQQPPSDILVHEVVAFIKAISGENDGYFEQEGEVE